jgi:hypothetical protein
MYLEEPQESIEMQLHETSGAADQGCFDFENSGNPQIHTTILKFTQIVVIVFLEVAISRFFPASVATEDRRAVLHSTEKQRRSPDAAPTIRASVSTRPIILILVHRRVEEEVGVGI